MYSKSMARSLERKKFGEPRISGSISGSIVEQELLGEVKPEYFKRFNDTQYVPYREAMRMIKEMQPFEPTDPEPKFANDLHATLAEQLSPENYAKLRFYTAVSKTHFDIFHGVDGMFEFQYGPQADDVVSATFDLTTYPKESWKADVLITIPHEGFDFTDPEDKKLCRACIENAAEKLAHVLQDNLRTHRPTAA